MPANTGIPDFHIARHRRQDKVPLLSQVLGLFLASPERVWYIRRHLSNGETGFEMQSLLPRRLGFAAGEKTEGVEHAEKLNQSERSRRPAAIPEDTALRDRRIPDRHDDFPTEGAG
jgi:hypothetical protein